MANSTDSLSFSKAETEALKVIVGDWLNEEISAPPIDPQTEAVLKKLGFAIPKSSSVSPVTQESASERGAIMLRARDQ